MLFLLYVWNHCFWQVWLQNKSVCNVLIKLSLRGLWYLRNTALRISIIYPLLYIIALNVMIESIKRLIKIFYHLPFQMQGETCLRGHDNLSTYVTCTCNYMLSNIFFSAFKFIIIYFFVNHKCYDIAANINSQCCKITMTHQTVQSSECILNC